MTKLSKKPLAVALGAAFALSGMAAQASVFQATDLAAGYMVAAADDMKEGKCGEGKCGGEKKMGAEGKCGEGKCGEAMFTKMDANKDGKLTKDEFMAGHKGAKAEGKCGEGKCGEGKCGSKK